MKIILNLILLILLGIPLSGCGVLEYFVIADSETNRDEPATSLSDEPPALVMQQGDSELTLQLGSYCWTGKEAAMCVDVIPPSYSAEDFITIAASEIVHFQFAGLTPDNIAVTLHAGSDLTGDTSGTVLLLPENDQFTWIFTGTSGQYVLMISARWDGGDAFYTLPITIES